MTDGPVQPPAAWKSLEKDYRAKSTEIEAVFEVLMNSSPLLRIVVADFLRNWSNSLAPQKQNARISGTIFKIKPNLEDTGTSARQKPNLDCVQHVMVLFDGNHHFFSPNLVRAGIQGAKSAIDTLVAEAKAFAREQHKNDLPDLLSVIVHIFIDVGKLADDLSTAGSPPDPDQLWTFIQNASKLEPGVTISDCGSGHHAVDAKIRHFYELYLENCHCRHLFLGLNRQSEYFKVLETYADDDYTKSKTSLVRLGGGTDNGYNLPFHTVDFSVIEAVPQQATSLSVINSPVNGTAKGTANGSSLAQRYEDPSTRFSTDSLSNPKPLVQLPRPSRPATFASNTENPTTRAIENMQMLPATISQMPAKIPAEVNGDMDNLDGSSSVGVVKLDTSSHSSRQSKAAEQSWENAQTNSYAPPAIAAPWGEEKTKVGQVVEEEPVLWRRSNNNHSRRQKQNHRNKERPFSAQPPRQPPRHFEGSWDDLVQSEQSKAPTQVSSPSPAPASATLSSAATKSNDLSPAFTRQALTKPDPNPLARPICSPIALNKLGQRIDLKLPREAPADHEAFELRVSNRQLCNEHHMRNNCNDPQCPFDHEEISDGIYLALRNIARSKPCGQGAECRRHDCYCAHHCPNISKYSTCARVMCPFQKKGLHSIVDLEIVETIEPPERKTQKEGGSLL
ncbi:hypothetical protein FOPE_00333 [Fonsecaea pedrosoi]|nr:hypothetical protein FOPE_00333 [Fonsecaea pedrosoi]